jgi:hypothetical protein
VQVLADSSYGRLAYTTLVSFYGRADAPQIGERVSADAAAWWKRVITRDAPSVVSRARGEQAMRNWSRKARR